MLELINLFFNKYKGVRRISNTILFALGVFATYQIFSNMTDVNNAVAACYSTLLTVLGASVWKYMDSSND